MTVDQSREIRKDNKILFTLVVKDTARDLSTSDDLETDLAGGWYPLSENEKLLRWEHHLKLRW